MYKEQEESLEKDLVVVLTAISKVTRAMARQLEQQKQRGGTGHEESRVRRGCKRIAIYSYQS